MTPLILALLLASTAHADALDDWQQQDAQQRTQHREDRARYEQRVRDGQAQYERMLQQDERNKAEMDRFRRWNRRGAR